MSLSDLTNEELDSRIDSASRDYRVQLGRRSFHTESSLSALGVLEPLWHEKDRRNRVESQRMQEERRVSRLARDLEEIISRRPLNPTPADISLFDPDDYQRVIKSSLGWAIIRSNTWDLYEFDVYLWKWTRRISEPRRKDIQVRWESKDPEPTQEDIDFATSTIEDRLKEVKK